MTEGTLRFEPGRLSTGGTIHTQEGQEAAQVGVCESSGYKEGGIKGDEFTVVPKGLLMS